MRHLIAILLAATFVFASCMDDDDDTMVLSDLDTVDLLPKNRNGVALVLGLQICYLFMQKMR